MLDFKLKASDHDLDTSTLDLILIGDAERVRQQLLIKLKLWRGEWFLDSSFGTPYLEEVLGKQLTFSGALAALKKSILEVEGVRRITSFEYEFNNVSRRLSVEFEVDTPYGIVEASS